MKTLILTILLMTMFAPFARASAIDTPTGTTIEANESRADAESDLYGEGTDAIDEENWTRAIDVFKRVAAMNGKRADGALYWMAYAQDKTGRGAEALQTLAVLERAHPNSKWIHDARALEIEIKKTDPSKVNDEELKVIAIQGLMNTDPERALPLLQKLVEGPYSRRVKQQALFVLSQSPSPQAAQIMAGIARGSAHPELQSEAIKFLGISGKKNLPLLGEIYQSSANADVKKEILRAYMVAGAKQPILVAARSEKDPHLRAEAIRQLGVLGGTRELAELYRAESSPELKRVMIESMFVGGGSDVLLDIARNEQDPRLRATAVRNLGLMGKEHTGAVLIGFYQKETAPEVKRAALEGLFVQGNARALIDLAKQEKDPRWKRRIVEQLSVMNSKEALDYLTSLLNE